MDEVIEMVPEKEKIIIRGDLIGHVRKERQESEKVNRSWGFEERNEVGKMILEFLEVYDLGIMNTYLKKRDITT